MFMFLKNIFLVWPFFCKIITHSYIPTIQIIFSRAITWKHVLLKKTKQNDQPVVKSPQGATRVRGGLSI